MGELFSVLASEGLRAVVDSMSFGMGGSLTAKGLPWRSTVRSARLSQAELSKAGYEW